MGGAGHHLALKSDSHAGGSAPYAFGIQPRDIWERETTNFSSKSIPAGAVRFVCRVGA